MSLTNTFYIKNHIGWKIGPPDRNPMDDIRVFLDLDMNIRLRKALAGISTFIRARTEDEAIREIEKAITHLQGIHRGLLDRGKLEDP